jgi:topoisomerase-4 subunit A
VEKFIVDKPYQYLPDGCKFLLLTEKQHGTITLIYRKAPRLRVLEEEFELDSYLVKGYKASGVRLSSKPIRTLRFTAKSDPSAAAPAAPAPAPAVPEKNEVEEEPVDSDEGYLLKF